MISEHSEFSVIDARGQTAAFHVPAHLGWRLLAAPDWIACLVTLSATRSALLAISGFGIIVDEVLASSASLGSPP